MNSKKLAPSQFTAPLHHTTPHHIRISEFEYYADLKWLYDIKIHEMAMMLMLMMTTTMTMTMTVTPACMFRRPYPNVYGRDKLEPEIYNLNGRKENWSRGLKWWLYHVHSIYVYFSEVSILFYWICFFSIIFIHTHSIGWYFL